MSVTLTHPNKGRQVSVPDEVAESYISQGWVVPGSPTPSEHQDNGKPRKRSVTKKGAARARAHDGEADAVPSDADGGADS
jgi:hypothetical protein